VWATKFVMITIKWKKKHTHTHTSERTGWQHSTSALNSGDSASNLGRRIYFDSDFRDLILNTTWQSPGQQATLFNVRLFSHPSKFIIL
jgi:hypothetical protein